MRRCKINRGLRIILAIDTQFPWEDDLSLKRGLFWSDKSRHSMSNLEAIRPEQPRVTFKRNPLEILSDKKFPTRAHLSSVAETTFAQNRTSAKL